MRRTIFVVIWTGAIAPLAAFAEGVAEEHAATVLWSRGSEGATSNSDAVLFGPAWLYLSTLLLASAVAGYLLVRSTRREATADEYAIVEDIIESVDD